MKGSGGSWRQPLTAVVLTVIAVAIAGSAAYALSSDEGQDGVVPTSGVLVPAESGVRADLPPSALALVDTASLQFIGTGPGGFRVWTGKGRDAAKAMVCYIAAGSSEGLPMSGTDCDSATAYAERGISLSGTSGPDGRFVGFAVVSEDLANVELDGQRLVPQNGVVFIDVRPGVRELRGVGQSRSVRIDLSERVKPLN